MQVWLRIVRGNPNPGGEVVFCSQEGCRGCLHVPLSVPHCRQTGQLPMFDKCLTNPTGTGWRWRPTVDQRGRGDHLPSDGNVLSNNKVILSLIYSKEN